MKNIVIKRLSANIDIQTPRKKIRISIFFDLNDFYISDNQINSCAENTNSLTLENVEDDITGDYYSYNGELFQFAKYKKDNFYFNNQIYGIKFYLPEIYNEANSGGIVLQLLPYKDIFDSTP